MFICIYSINAHIFKRAFPRQQFPLSEFILGQDITWKVKLRQRALSQDRTDTRNLLLFSFSFQEKQACPKQMLHHRSSSLRTQTCVLSDQEQPGTMGQNLRFQASRNLAQVLPSAAFYLLLPEPPSQTFPTSFNKPASQKHSFAKSQHWGIRQAKCELDIKVFHWKVGTNPNPVSPFRITWVRQTLTELFWPHSRCCYNKCHSTKQAKLWFYTAVIIAPFILSLFTLLLTERLIFP